MNAQDRMVGSGVELLYILHRLLASAQRDRLSSPDGVPCYTMGDSLSFAPVTMKAFERYFEKLLWSSRYMILVAVVASIVSAFIMVVLGTLDVFLVARELIRAAGERELTVTLGKKAFTYVITAVDAYLIATVLLIFGMGLYELFISKIDEAEKNTRSSRILIIHTLDELKEKLAKVILMVLIVTFFKFAVGLVYEDVKSLLYLGIGIFLLSLSVYFMHKGGHPEK